MCITENTEGCNLTNATSMGLSHNMVKLRFHSGWGCSLCGLEFTCRSRELAHSTHLPQVQIPIVMHVLVMKHSLVEYVSCDVELIEVVARQIS